MVYQGIVHNGMIVFDNGVQLPEGAAVRVELLGGEKGEPTQSAKVDIVFRMGDYAGDTGISDLGVNIDHYLYGHPKVIDGE